MDSMYIFCCIAIELFTTGLIIWALKTIKACCFCWRLQLSVVMLSDKRIYTQTVVKRGKEGIEQTVLHNSGGSCLGICGWRSSTATFLQVLCFF